MATSKVIYRLEMSSPRDHVPRQWEDEPSLEARQVMEPCPEFSRFLFEAVGSEYMWSHRAVWQREHWREFANRPDLKLYVGLLGGNPVGYYELIREEDGSVRIFTFGLLPQFVGRGLGGPLLSAAIDHAWQWDAKFVWLTTCSHDHPHAFKNYLARGFKQTAMTEGPPNPPAPPFWR